MGDDPIPPESDLSAVSGSYPGQNLDAQQFHSQSTPDEAPPAYLHQSYTIPQQALNLPYDMAQPQGPVRPGPYNMAALATALPQPNYRQGHFNPTQLRYNPSATSPNIVGQTQHMPQYGGQPPMGHMPNHSYYMQQPPQMSPYYGSPISPSQQQSNMSPRPNMPYYSNMTNQSHPSMAYYYPQMPTYAPQGQLQHQAMPVSYMPGAGHQHDPRLGPPHQGDMADGAPFPHNQQEQRQCKLNSQDMEKCEC